MEVLTTLSVKEFNSLCRFCTKKQRDLKPIFKEENDGGCFEFTNSLGDNGIVNMLSECTGLETSPSDGLPLFICSECYQKLLDSHSFRNQCIESVDKLRKIRLSFNNVKKEDDDSNDPNNSFFADTFADNDGWEHDEDDNENYEDQKTETRKLVIEPVRINRKEPSPKRKPTTKRKAPAKRKSKATAKRKKANDDSEAVDDVKIETTSTPLNESAEASVDEMKPELDPVTGEIVMPTVPVEGNKSNRKRDRTKGPKLKKEKKPYVRKPNKPEQCDVCGFISRSLKSHMLVHTQERNFECDFCGKKFALRASLKNHIFAHINIRAFVCTLCPSSFKNSALLYKHQDVHKTEPMKFICDFCQRKFRRKFDLNNHMLCHTQIRKYNCDHCTQTFLTRRGLRNHVGLHTNERQFICGICPLRFLHSSSAAIHRRIHKVNNAFKCDLCSVEVKNFRNFRMHLEVCREKELKSVVK